MIAGLTPNESTSVPARLSQDLLEFALDRIARAVRGDLTVDGVSQLRRLRELVHHCAPERPAGSGQLGALPDILGTAVTLQYPMVQLESLLLGDPCDIRGPDQAEQYLSFLRYHLWKLEHLLRASA